MQKLKMICTHLKSKKKNGFDSLYANEVELSTIGVEHKDIKDYSGDFFN